MRRHRRGLPHRPFVLARRHGLHALEGALEGAQGFSCTWRTIPPQPLVLRAKPGEWAVNACHFEGP